MATTTTPNSRGHRSVLTKAAPWTARMTANGTVSGYAATFDRIPDYSGDVIRKGAFAESLRQWKERGTEIPLLYNHDQSLDNFIGRLVEAREDSTGLWIVAEFEANSENAQRARELVRDKRLTKFSFAYSVLDQGSVTMPDGTRANELRKLDLLEVSLVLSPANPRAVVTDAKRGNLRRDHAREHELELARARANASLTLLGIDAD